MAIIIQLALIVIAALLLVTQHVDGVSQWDSGAGIVYRLQVTQDVWLERATSNYNNYEFIIVGVHTGYPKKRSLLQFENLPSTCAHIKSAKMYLYFSYSHKASFQTVQQAPYIARPLQVHQVKKEWHEAEATSSLRMTGHYWSESYLALDGTDADPNGLLCQPVTIYTSRPAGWVEFDITEALCNWQSGDPNYGVLLLATNEDSLGRDTRFYSNAHSDGGRHAYVNVLCD